MRMLRQRKKKWTTAHMRQRKSQLQRLNQKMRIQITISLEGNSAQVYNIFIPILIYQHTMHFRHNLLQGVNVLIIYITFYKSGTNFNSGIETLSKKDKAVNKPKHIVFLTQLLLLFGFCCSCKQDNQRADVYQVGTQVVVTTTFSNPKCPKPKDTCQSQSFLSGTKFPAVSSLLGHFVSQGICILSVTLKCCILSITTFFTYQRQVL